jgi:hypothetical protein
VSAQPRVALTILLVVLTATSALSAEKSRPDFSGFWSPERGQLKSDPVLSKFVTPGAVVMLDTGAAEFGLMEFGGLKPKPAALEAARTWVPSQEMTVSNACKVPSIVYALQGPFPIEIFQGRDMLAMRMEYFDMARLVFLDGRSVWPPDAPHSKTGYSVGKWQGDVLSVTTTHLKAATITNNGLEHSDGMQVIEHYRLADGGKRLIVSQEYFDPEVLENRGVRYIAWQRLIGDHVRAYDCDPAFAENYAKP